MCTSFLPHLATHFLSSVSIGSLLCSWIWGAVMIVELVTSWYTYIPIIHRRGQYLGWHCMSVRPWLVHVKLKGHTDLIPPNSWTEPSSVENVKCYSHSAPDGPIQLLPTNHRHFPLYPATAPDSPYLGRKVTRRKLETKIQLQLLVHGCSGTRKLARKLIRRSRNPLAAIPKDLFESAIAILVISMVSRHNIFPLVEILFHLRQT